MLEVSFPSRMISESEINKLYLFKNGIQERYFPVSIGLNGVGKRKEGDKKTPLGEYQIAWMVSRHGNKGNKIINGQTWCNEKNSQLYYGQSGSADEQLWSESYGGDEATVMGLNYPNDEDKKKGYTGSCIEIHASFEKKPEELKPTLGCIKMYQEDALALYNNVDVGTKVFISDSAKTQKEAVKGYMVNRERKRNQ